LQEKYGLDSHTAEYATEHAEADAGHADEGWAMARAYAGGSPDRQQEILRLYDEYANIWWRLFDGIVLAYVHGKMPVLEARFPVAVGERIPEHVGGS
jgi:pyrroloquinoline quinone (PQQ) biosynthesis protein C